MTPNAYSVFMKRYTLKDKQGNPIETVEDAVRRVAKVVGGRKLEDTFYDLLIDFKFVPNSPTWTGAGTKLGNLSACFTLEISDDMGKERTGIFSTLRDAALIQQTGGGNGFNFSNLRPKNDLVASSNGIATGPVGFIKVYDKAFGEIAQGGTRRGANMAILNCNHPDIREFIHCKDTESDVTNFNVSVGVYDSFMQAVENDTTWDLINPRTKEVVETVRAKDLFYEIVSHAHYNAEPGILFLDHAEKDNAFPELYKLQTTNPCAEQYMGAFSSCNLGNIHLGKYVRDGEILWNELREVVRLGVSFLDKVIDANKYIPAIPELKETSQNERRIGLSIMGLADMFYLMGIRYGSDESYDLASQAMEFIRYEAMTASCLLAQELGQFPYLPLSVYSPTNWKWQPPKGLVPHIHNWKRPQLDWSHLAFNIKQFGIRNSVITTIVPGGTTGTVASVEGYGCEPVFALSYSRWVVEKDGSRTQLTYYSPLFEKTIRETLNHSEAQRVLAEVSHTGSCQDIYGVPGKVREVYVVSNDISPEAHIKMQAVLQAWIDNAISKTCNLPRTATVEDVAQSYFLAWKLGCKGVTVYVEGSRDKVVLETKETYLAKNGSYSEAEKCASGVCQI